MIFVFAFESFSCLHPPVRYYPPTWIWNGWNLWIEIWTATWNWIGADGCCFCGGGDDDLDCCCVTSTSDLDFENATWSRCSFDCRAFWTGPWTT